MNYEEGKLQNENCKLDSAFITLHFALFNFFLHSALPLRSLMPMIVMIVIVARFMLTSTMIVCVAWQHFNAVSQRHSQQQGSRKLEAVMRMEMDFRQQIA